MSLTKKDIEKIALVIAGANSHPAPEDYAKSVGDQFDALTEAEAAPSKEASKDTKK